MQCQGERPGVAVRLFDDENLCSEHEVSAAPDCEGARRSGLRGSRQDRPKPVHLKLQVDCQRLLESHFRYMLRGMYFFYFFQQKYITQ